MERLSDFATIQGEELLTPQEAAKFLKVSTRTIYNWLRKNQLPARKYGGLWRISFRELLEMVEDSPSA